MDVVMDFLGSFGISVLIAIVAVGLLIYIASRWYVKVPPDRAMIISGFRKEPRIIIGRSVMRIPFLERIDTIPLSLMQIDIRTELPVPTNEFINIYVDGVANIKIGDNDDFIRLAMRNFLGQSTDEIAVLAKDVLEGNMREIVGQLTLEELVKERDIFADKVRANAAEDMNAMGLEIVNFAVQNFRDENNVINDMGTDNITKIRKKAAIAKAQSEKEIAIEQSRSRQEANDAEVESKREIAKKNSMLLNEEAELKVINDSNQARADAAYALAKTEQDRLIRAKEVEIEIAITERQAELTDKEVEVQKRTLETVRNQADAELYKKQKETESIAYTAQKKAETDASVIRLNAEAEADGERARANAKRDIALAEAEGIRAIGEADAAAIYAKAEAMEKMGTASITEMTLETLPKIAESVAKPLGRVEKIVMYGDGNVPKLVGDVMNSTSQIMNGLGEAGLDMNFVSQLADSIRGAQTKQTEKPSESSEK